MRFTHYFRWHPGAEAPEHVPFAESKIMRDLYPIGKDGSLSELDALRIMDMWNRGDHHDFRYWLSRGE